MLTYEEQEATRHARYIDSLEKAPLSERNEAQSDFMNLLTDLDALTRTVIFLHNGSYGYHAEVIAKRIIASSKRNNKAAQMAQLAAEYESRCPARHAIAAYKQLTKAEQDAANNAIMAYINDAIPEDK